MQCVAQRLVNAVGARHEKCTIDKHSTSTLNSYGWVFDLTRNIWKERRIKEGRSIAAVDEENVFIGARWIVA